MYVEILICSIYIYICIIPEVPHKALAEVSKIGNSGMDGKANPLMDRKVVGVVPCGVVAVVTSTTTAGCSVVQCSAM